MFHKLKRLFSSKGAPEDCLDDVLLRLGGGDVWTIRDSFEGTQIFGAIGSGKTTGSGQTIAEAFLKAGFGGIVLTVKPDELANWQTYMERTGRDDLIVFEPGAKWTFNFLEYERGNETGGSGLTENLVALFSTVLEVAERTDGSQGEGAFWRRTMRQLLRNAIGLIRLTDHPVSVVTINDLVQSVPHSLDQSASIEWRRNSFCAQCLDAAERLCSRDAGKDFDHTRYAQYFLLELPGLAPETRGSILTTFTSFADVMLSSPVREMFSPAQEDRDTTLTPELTRQGKVIVLNLPVKTFHQVGQFTQVLYKYVWQRAMERCALGGSPVFIWADEAQHFVNSHDMMFQTTARSARAATVFLTQNISNYYATLAGDKGRAEIDSLMGNVNTKIFHSNTDHITNDWAAKLIGQHWKTMTDRSTSVGTSQEGRTNAGKWPLDGNASANMGTNRREELHYQVRPEEFATLRKGGKANDFWIDGVFFQGGRAWSDGKTHGRVSFRQKRK